MNPGKVTKQQDGFQVYFERSLPFPIETVWNALTDPKQLAQWFTDIEMDFVEGGKVIIRFRDEAKTESVGKIIRIEPPTLFEFMWEEELATWKLFPEGKLKCKLTLTYSKLPDTYAMSVAAGWHIILDQLEEVLNEAPGYYPFGGEENELTKKMRKLYEGILTEQFPELKKQ